MYSVWVEYSDSSKEAASVANDLCDFTLDLTPSISWPKRHNLIGFRSGLNFDEGMMFYLQERIQRLHEQEHPDNPMGHGLILLDPFSGNNYQGFQDFDTRFPDTDNRPGVLFGQVSGRAPWAMYMFQKASSILDIVL